MTPEVEAAIQQLQEAYGGHALTVEPEDQGGAYVVIDDVDIGPLYLPSTTWIGFIITFQYPEADVYLHYIDPSVVRRDGEPRAEGLSGPTEWNGRQALQISRRSKRWNPAYDNALIKLTKVLEWMKQGCPKSR